MITDSLRCSERLRRELKAELILEGKIYDTTIENLSESGIRVRTATVNTAVVFLPNALLDLQFELPSGETARLHCKVIWSRKNSPKSLLTDIGLEFTEKSPLYEEYFKTLSIDNMSLLYGC